MVNILFKREGEIYRKALFSCRMSAKSALYVLGFLPTNSEESKWEAINLQTAEIISAEEMPDEL